MSPEEFRNKQFINIETIEYLSEMSGMSNDEMASYLLAKDDLHAAIENLALIPSRENRDKLDQEIRKCLCDFLSNQGF